MKHITADLKWFQSNIGWYYKFKFLWIGSKIIIRLKFFLWNSLSIKIPVSSSPSLNLLLPSCSNKILQAKLWLFFLLSPRPPYPLVPSL